jgi:hypothetical protein
VWDEKSRNGISLMPGNSRELITLAERRFPVRIRVAVPPGGLGQRHSQITAWLDENCGADGWAMAPSGMRGVLNDAVSIYFFDATLASAFAAGGAPFSASRALMARFKCGQVHRCHGPEPDCIGPLKEKPGRAKTPTFSRCSGVKRLKPG